MTYLAVDRERCIGAGQCVLTAPELFDQDDEGLVTTRSAADLTADVHGVVDELVQLCPSGALRLSENSEESTSPIRRADV